jgi:DNA polymerase-4
VPRTILHVDLDAFFAAVEQRDDPGLRGKPVLVGGSARRGVVAACSYEARAFGIHSAMPMAEALRRCPRAVVVRHHMERYAEASRGFFAILEAFSPDVEGLSLDEAFLDVTGAERLLGDGAAIARAIKQRVRAELALVASVGVAPIKLAAKIASDIDKPDGLRVIAPADLLAFLHPLPVTRLWGVGEATRAALDALGLATIGDVARYPEAALAARLGPSLGHHLAVLARGEDARAVEAEREPVSIGHQETFEDDHDDRGELAVTLLDQADRVAARLRASALRARALVLLIKYDDFRQITRRATLERATSDGGVLARTAIDLLAGVAIAPRAGSRVRLCGVSATQLEPRDAPQQLSFDEAARARGERLGDALDRVAARFGRATVRRAIHLRDPAPPAGAPSGPPAAGRRAERVADPGRPPTGRAARGRPR